MGFEAVKTLVDKLKGVASPKQIDVPARVVRKADLDKPDVHDLLYPKLK
jgi:ABC-type sugar transport system substrate-binding protein